MASQIRDFPMAIKQPALTLINVAARDVRGQGFSWIEKDIVPWEEWKK